MLKLKKLTLALASASASLALVAAPSQAVVGGSDAAAGEFPSVAEITFGAFGCTGTLIAPNWVLTAGHCGSVTGGSGVGTPAGWPTALISVRIGSNKTGQGESVPVSSVTLNPNYLANKGYDISLLKLSRNSTKAPTKVSGAGSTAAWAPGVLGDIVGWGYTSEGGSSPATLQKAQVPIRTDAYCASTISGYSAATMLCAGYDAGGVDTCQGDSGGPLFGRNAAGARVVVGATSFGNGCARANNPGAYARVGDTILRTWIQSKAPAGVE
jgi:secreted trypsin-like serine protease